MNKLSEANLSHSPAFTATEAVSAIGMAALWTSAFKRMLYPMAYTYYRTGDAGAIAAQGVYAIAFALACCALFAARKRISTSPHLFRWAVALLGVCGSAGIGILKLAENPAYATPELYTLSGLLSAVYIPVHVAFWFIAMKRQPEASAKRSFVWSLGIFAVAYALLGLLGAQSMLVSGVCPLVSGAMALIVPVEQPARKQKERLGLDQDTSAAAQAIPGPDQDAPAATQAVLGSDQNAPKAIQAALESVQAAPATTASAPEAAQAASGTDNGEQQRAAAAPSREPTEGKLFDPLIEQFAEDFGLSDREAELAAYTYRNYSARRIAEELFIAESTVYTHQKRIYRKCGVHSKSELIAQIDDWKRQR